MGTEHQHQHVSDLVSHADLLTHCCLLMLQVDFMSEMYPSIKFIHACPGFVATRWGMEMPWALRCMVRVLQTVAKPAADCAECMCYGLFSQDLKAKHFYLMQQDGGEAKPTALHAEAKEFMKQHTLKIFAEYLK